MNSRRGLVLKAVATALLAGPLAACDRLFGHAEAPVFNATDITGAEFARKLELPDTDGKMRSLADWKGKVTVVFFGFTQCPEVCPTTLAELSQIKRSLGAEGDELQTVFVTVDPERDTPAILKAYVGNFGPRVHGPARHARADGGSGQGVQGLLCQGAGQDARQLLHGSQRRVVRLRQGRTGPPVCAVWRRP